MSEENLKDFFRKKKQKSGGDIDWEARKEAWIKAIENLYEKIRKNYLADLITEESVTVSEPEKTIVEDYIGQYTVRELALQVGDERVVFSPKGRNIVGASGRIDLIGEMGEQTLVVQPDERWGIVATRTPTLKVVPIDEASLLSALKRVMRR